MSAMSVAAHLGIAVRDYDARIRVFIPNYEAMLDAAAGALRALQPRPATIVDLGVGSGALSARCLAAVRGAALIGIDRDPEMLALATKRLGRRLTVRVGDFTTQPLPRCDAFVASLALHHIRTRSRKSAFYSRCLAALRPGGALINADLCPASSPRLQNRDHVTWRKHLEREYTRSRAESLIASWAKDDTYFRLTDEIDLLESAGFEVDVPWRQGGFAVVVGSKPPRRRRR
jgi:trans-aconitate methyltransferase